MAYNAGVLAVLGLETSNKLAGLLLVRTPREGPRIVRRPGLQNHVREWISDGTTLAFVAQPAA